MGVTMARRRINKVQERVLGRKPVLEATEDKPKKRKPKKSSEVKQDGSE